MQKRTRIIACLLCAALLAVLPSALAAPEETAGPVIYTYVLERSAVQPTTGYDTNFDLYVVASDPEAPPLHTGSVALAVESTTIRAQVAGGYAAQPLDAGKLPGVTVTDGIGYETQGSRRAVSFTWFAEFSQDVSTLTVNGRQHVASVTIGRGAGQGDPQLVELLPWTETVSGRALMAQLSAAGEKDPESLRDLILTLWRCEKWSSPETGYYQGFYAQEDAPDGSDQFRTDIRNGWQALRVVSYDPKDPIRVELYLRKEDGKYGASPDYTKTIDGEAGVGQSVRTLALADGTYTETATGKTVQAAALPQGTYRLEIVKQSHVRAICSGVTVTDKGLFPEIAGQRLVLPCGDVDASGHIGQKDRALLTARGRYGSKAADKTAEKPEGEPYDLDGDGFVNQRDLAILIAPSNYGKTNLKLTFGDDGV